MRQHDVRNVSRVEQDKHRNQQIVALLPTNKMMLNLMLLLGLLSASVAVQADEYDQRRYTAAINVAVALDTVPVSKDYALGIHRFNPDQHTEILGWRLANDWYFGRQDGLDSGLTLVWQQSSNQFSFSKEGVRLTRRF